MKRSTNLNRYRKARGMGAFVDLCKYVGMSDQAIVDAVAKTAAAPRPAPELVTPQPAADRGGLAGLDAFTGPGDMPDDPAIVDAAIAAATWSE